MKNLLPLILLVLLFLLGGCAENKEEPSTTESNKLLDNKETIENKSHTADEEKEIQTPKQANPEEEDDDEKAEIRQRQQEQWELFEQDNYELLPEED